MLRAPLAGDETLVSSVPPTPPAREAGVGAETSRPGRPREGGRRLTGAVPIGNDGATLPRDGDQFGRYRIHRLLGEGGMAVVYHAYDPKHDRHVALKVLKPEWRREPEALERFLREARAAGGLSGPHIAIIYDSGERPAPFIAMELIEGPTLAELLRRGRLAVPDAVRLVRDLAEALAYAHARGRVHRDIKPSNVLLSGPELTPKLADFGIAVIAAEATQLTRHDHTPGTPRYMSPEQWRGEPVDARGDLFSLGVTFYEMLTGRRAFGAAAVEVLGYQITHEPPPPLRELAPRTPPSVAAIVDRLMAKRAEDRFQSARDLLAALDAAGHAPRRPARKAAVVVTVGVVVAVLGGAGFWWATPANRPPVARPAERTIEAGQATEIDLGPLVSDPDQDRLEFAAALSADAPGSLELTGTRVRYDSGSAFAGLPRGASRTVRVLYRAGDGRGRQAAADIVIRVLGTRVPNRPPRTAEDSARTAPGERVVLDVLANDHDPDPGDRPRLIAAELVPGGPGAARVVDGRVVYDPGSAPTSSPGRPRVAEIRYTIADGAGAEARGRARVGIDPPPPREQPPEATPPLPEEASPRALSYDDRRCRHVMERFQLGEPLSDEDQALLQSRCGS